MWTSWRPSSRSRTEWSVASSSYSSDRATAHDAALCVECSAQADLVMAPPSQCSTRPNSDPTTARIGQHPVRYFGGATSKIGVQADTAEQAVVRIDDREVCGLFAEPHHVAVPDPHACLGDRVDPSDVPMPDVSGSANASITRSTSPK